MNSVNHENLPVLSSSTSDSKACDNNGLALFSNKWSKNKKRKKKGKKGEKKEERLQLKADKQCFVVSLLFYLGTRNSNKDE